MLRVLVVDDQYARDPAAQLNFLEKTRLINEDVDVAGSQPWGSVTFCSGQRRTNGRIENDYGVVSKAVARGGWALVMLDVRFDSGRVDVAGRVSGQAGDDNFGERVRQRLAADFPHLPVVMLSSKHGIELDDHTVPYLSKQRLGEREMRKALLEHGKLEPDQVIHVLALEHAVARAPATVDAFRNAFIHAGSDVSVLILGESGVGKEVLARYIHEVSGRSGEPFVAVNVAAIPRDLVESELFGHEKGAFTGAVSQRQGRFEQVAGGTLFMDEVGDMPLDTQAKVLRVLQERKITRVGGSRELDVDLRLLCATSRDLPRMMEEGSFREDLFHRIAILPIRLPPLRERREDIVALAQRFLANATERYGKEGVKLSTNALAMLELQSYPGNVRELENVISRLVSGAGHHEVIGPDSVRHALGAMASSRLPNRAEDDAPVSASNAPGLSLDQLIGAMKHMDIDPMDPALAGIKPRLEIVFHSLLKRLGGAALERCRDPVTKAHNRQKAMQLLTGDSTLKGKGPLRTVNELLRRNQENRVENTDLDQLVEAWKNPVNPKERGP